MKHPIWAAKMNRSNTKQVVSGGNGIDLYMNIINVITHIYIYYIYNIYIIIIYTWLMKRESSQVLIRCCSSCRYVSSGPLGLGFGATGFDSDIQTYYIIIYDICDVYLSPIFKSKISNSGELNFVCAPAPIFLTFCLAQAMAKAAPKPKTGATRWKPQCRRAPPL